MEEKQKQIVMGIVQRNGKAYFRHISSTGKWELLKQIQKYVDPTARVLTDEWGGYVHLPKFGYQHEFVTHSASQYVRGDVHTNTVEGFWGGLKRGVYGVYRVVSKKYLQAYVDEYAFRYNHRNEAPMMFDILFNQIASVKAVQLA